MALEGGSFLEEWEKNRENKTNLIKQKIVIESFVELVKNNFDIFLK